jgi:LysR family hydrogen peroxide-inducible transcriptional activator
MSRPWFTLRQLQYAAAVAELLSFRRAAEQCRVSQPSLSAQIGELEQSLGVRLFERDRRRVLLTTAGREILERVRRCLTEADDLVTAARRLGDPLDGPLHVGVIPTVSPYLLPRITPALRREFPRLVLRWVEDKTPALVQALEAGDLDAALLALEADLGELERDEIASDPFVLATPAGHPLGARTGAAAPAELQGAGVLLLDDGHCFREQALAFCAGAKARELEFRATSLSTLAQMVAGGAGVTLLPLLAIPTETRRAGLRIRPFAPPGPHRTLGLVWRPGSPLGPALRRVAATMRRAYGIVPDPGGRLAARGPARRRRPKAASGGRRRTSREL